MTKSQPDHKLGSSEFHGSAQSQEAKEVEVEQSYKLIQQSRLLLDCTAPAALSITSPSPGLKTSMDERGVLDLDWIRSTNLALHKERDDLVLADRHICEGEERVAQQVARIAQMSEQGQDTTRAKDLLKTLEAALVQWHVHRQIILETIARHTASLSGRAI